MCFEHRLAECALLTADGFLLNSACVVVQLASASEIAAALMRRAQTVIFTVDPLIARGEHRRNFCYVKLHVGTSLTQPSGVIALEAYPLPAPKQCGYLWTLAIAKRYPASRISFGRYLSEAPLITRENHAGQYQTDCANQCCRLNAKITGNWDAYL